MNYVTPKLFMKIAFQKKKGGGHGMKDYMKFGRASTVTNQPGIC